MKKIRLKKYLSIYKKRYGGAHRNLDHRSKLLGRIVLYFFGSDLLYARQLVEVRIPVLKGRGVSISQLKAGGWIKELVKQRSDSTQVLATLRELNRLEAVGEMQERSNPHLARTS